MWDLLYNIDESIYDAICEVCENYDIDFHMDQYGDTPYVVMEDVDGNVLEVKPICKIYQFFADISHDDFCNCIENIIRKCNANFIRVEYVGIKKSFVILDMYVGRIDGYKTTKSFLKSIGMKHDE